MKLVFSRKGFDSANGGRPSPIIDGRPVSLPIPERVGASTTYGQLGLGQLVSKVTRDKLSADDGCHDDPMFADGFCWFGQSGAAQGHLRKQDVGTGDVFVFFGLFADEASGARHHRIYGLMDVAGHAPAEQIRSIAGWREPPRPHPHLSDKPRRQNTIYFGEAVVARHATAKLRLTRPSGPASRWSIPAWLASSGLSRHANPDRWEIPGELATVAIGQEFVCTIDGLQSAQAWLAEIREELSR